MKITISKENYLKAIAEAESEGEPVIAATLARWLNVSAPAVTMAIKRLKRDALIRVSKDGEISEHARDAVLSEMKMHFRPEFLNRVDEIVLFKALTLPEIKQIVVLLTTEI